VVENKPESVWGTKYWSMTGSDTIRGRKIRNIVKILHSFIEVNEN
jgi:negative regulator of replication initiation